MVTATSLAIQQLAERLPTSLKRLADLAYNYWWSWTPDRIGLFPAIEANLWRECGHNPVKLLQQVSAERLSQVSTDPYYLNQLDALVHQFDQYLQAQSTWASQVAPGLSGDRPVAYFCAEFGLHESLPIYSGGLGVLAGDHLKSASDVGVPLVGIGLLYRQGYFRQRLNRSGWQEDYYVDSDFDHMPLELMRSPYGEPLIVELLIRQRLVRTQIWRVKVGRVDLYLLDTDREDNDPIDRWLTGHLYGGNQDTRIAQEVVLGIGGVRALHLLGITPAMYHLNEGHAAFALLEVARQDIEQTGQSFYDVELAVRDRAMFTTHTAVSADQDLFSPDLIDAHFADYWPQLGLSREQFLALGSQRLGDPWESFGMTVLALRLTRAANGVSEQHGQVARKLWQGLYPERAVDHVPIGHITNGVHGRSWIAPLLSDLYEQYLGQDWSKHQADPRLWDAVDRIPAAELWRRHCILKARLIAYTQFRVRLARASRGEDPDSISAVDRLLDPNVLTLGFARSFSAHKRGALIMQDYDRALKILNHRKRPVQIIFSGKAHPADEDGKRIIQRLMEWCQHPAIRDRVAFIEDYDLFTAQKLVHGVDVWLNTPQRPQEASGISGQKVSLNGGINCSVLDGWWCEGYQAKDGKGYNGWAIGQDLSSGDQAQQDARDAASLYRLLEEDIIPLYYDRGTDGIPHGWVAMMKASIQTCAPRFNSDRMVAEYVTTMYAPDTSEPDAIDLTPILQGVVTS